MQLFCNSILAYSSIYYFNIRFFNKSKTLFEIRCDSLPLNTLSKYLKIRFLRKVFPYAKLGRTFRIRFQKKIFPNPMPCTNISNSHPGQKYVKFQFIEHFYKFEANTRSYQNRLRPNSKSTISENDAANMQIEINNS